MNRFLIPFILLLSACGQAGVLIDIGTWPDGAVSLKVDGFLNGAPMTEPLSFPGSPTQFVVYVPQGESGQLSLSFTALDENDCPRATGQAEVQVGRGLRRLAQTRLALSAVTPPYCPAPRLSAVSPASGPNNGVTNLTLTGSGFRAGARVTVGGAICTNVRVVSTTQLTCAAPAQAATCGPQAVIVTNRDNQTAMGNLYTYRPLSVSFGATTNLPGGGTSQRQVITADFNADGRPDLAANNAGSNDVSIYLNNGSGGFGAATNIPVGMLPIGLAAGDLNKDSKLDLVIANAGSDNISFLAGNGTGGFAAAVHTAGFNAPQGVGIGDINNDGSLDVLVTNANTNTVAVLLGNGTGMLVMGTAVRVGNFPEFLALADLNKDGKLDLVTPNAVSNDISFRPGNGNGTFGAGIDIAGGTFPSFAAVGDVNGDQNPDIVVSNLNSHDVTVLLGSGAGTFNAAAGSPFAVGMGPWGVSVVDIDGDGILDLVSANSGSDNLSILAGNGLGAFNAISGSPFSAPGSPFGIASGDFNGDGLIDLATANTGGNNTAVRLALCN